MQNEFETVDEAYNEVIRLREEITRLETQVALLELEAECGSPSYPAICYV